MTFVTMYDILWTIYIPMFWRNLFLYLQGSPSIQVPQVRWSNFIFQFLTMHPIPRVFRCTGSIFYFIWQVLFVISYPLSDHIALILSASHLHMFYWRANVMSVSLVAMRNLLEKCMFQYNTHAKYSSYKKLILWTGTFMWCMLEK